MHICVKWRGRHLGLVLALSYNRLITQINKVKTIILFKDWNELIVAMWSEIKNSIRASANAFCLKTTPTTRKKTNASNSNKNPQKQINNKLAFPLCKFNKKQPNTAVALADYNSAVLNQELPFSAAFTVASMARLSVSATLDDLQHPCRRWSWLQKRGVRGEENS